MAYDPELERKFEQLSKLAQSSPLEQVQMAENVLKDNVVTAASRIVEQLDSHRESTVFNAAKYICDRVLPRNNQVPGDDPLAKFLEEIKTKAGSN